MSAEVPVAAKAGFGAGVRLFGESVARAFRMRNVWILFAVCAVADVGAQVVVARAWPETLQAASRPPAGAAATVSASLAQRWREPAALPGNLVRGVQRPLNAALAGAQTPVLMAADRVFGLQWDPLERPAELPLLLSLLMVNALYAVLTVGTLRWVVAALRGERARGRLFVSAVRRGTLTIYVWLLALEGLAVVSYAVTSHSSPVVAGAVGSGVALVLLPLALLPFRAVARRESLVPAARGSVRLMASRAAVLAGFLLCVRVAAEAVSWLTMVRQASFPFPHGPFATLPPSELAVAMAATLLQFAVALVLCTGFMTIVESPRGTAAAPEVVPA